jgi:hypothetical protein
LRVVLSLAVLALLGQAPKPNSLPTVWEKPIAPGLVYREEIDQAAHRSVQALRITVKCPAIRVMPDLFGHFTYKGPNQTGRGPLSQMVLGDKALAGVNGDFFSMEKGPSGDPLGITVRDGRLMATPSKRVAFGWGPDQAVMSVATFSGTAQSDNTVLRIDAINRRCGKDQVTLDTRDAGLALSESPCVSAVLKFASPSWSPSTVLRGTVVSISADQTSTQVGLNEAVLVARGSKADSLAQLKPGASIAVVLKTIGFDWVHIDNVIGGGPVLVKQGMIAVDGVEEGFQASFTDSKHPRTAIGRTPEGDLWLVAVDGRQETGDGMTLTELAQTMKNLGCSEAMNLDGGGSTTMNVLGVTVNRPSDGQERSIADGVLILGQKARPSRDTLRLSMPQTIAAGTIASAWVQGGRGRLPAIGVIWGCTGACAINQGGVLQALHPGQANVQAYAAGQLLTGAIQVTQK